jgi:hypothetical protein
MQSRLIWVNFFSKKLVHFTWNPIPTRAPVYPEPFYLYAPSMTMDVCAVLCVFRPLVLWGGCEFYNTDGSHSLSLSLGPIAVCAKRFYFAPYYGLRSRHVAGRRTLRNVYASGGGAAAGKWGATFRRKGNGFGDCNFLNCFKVVCIALHLTFDWLTRGGLIFLLRGWKISELTFQWPWFINQGKGSV